jgi:hypothetical protein
VFEKIVKLQSQLKTEQIGQGKKSEMEATNHLLIFKRILKGIVVPFMPS